MHFGRRFFEVEHAVLSKCSGGIFDRGRAAKDVITLMTVFCARLYGRRSRKAESRTASEEKLGNSDENKLEFNTVSNGFCSTIR